MSFPSIVNSNSGYQDGGSSFAAPLPASIVAGNLLFIFVRECFTPMLQTVGGWNTLVSPIQTPNDDDSTAAFWKVATGAEGSTQTVTTNGSPSRFETLSIQVTGVRSATNPEITSRVAGFGTTADSAALTPSWGVADTLWLLFCASNTNITPQTNPPTSTDGDNFSSPIEAATPTTGSGGGILDIWWLQKRAATIDPNTITLGTSPSYDIWTIGIAGPEPPPITDTALHSPMTPTSPNLRW